MSADPSPSDPASLADLLPAAQRIRTAVQTVIEGKPEVIDTALTVLLAEGHLLIEDVPGVGKTHARQDARPGASTARSAGSSSPPTCCPAT